VVLVLLVLTAAPPASAAFLCIVRVAPVPGLEPGVLDSALALERRKWDLAFDQVESANLEACPAALTGEPRTVLVIGPGATGRLLDASGTPRFVDLETTAPGERASELARFTLALMPSPRTASPTALVPGPVPGHSRIPAEATMPPPRAALSGYVEAGGWYAWQREPRIHAAGLSIETGVAAFDERLLAGLRVGYQTPADIAGGGSRVQAVPVTVVVHGGFRWTAALLRLVLEAGLEWRRIEVEPSAWAGSVSDRSLAGVLGGEVEAVFPVSENLRIGVAVTARGYVGGPSLAWNGEQVYRAPSLAVGAAVRLGGVFPSRRAGEPAGRGDGRGR
jgi:hypothetical protein